MILRHRDTEVLRFEWLEPQGVRVVSVNAEAERFQPLDFRGAPTDENLWKWLTRRIVPSHRHYIQIMLANLSASRLEKIEDFLQKRVSQILEFGEESDRFLQIERNSGSVKPVNDESLAVQIKENLRADPFITYNQISDLLQIPPRTLARRMKKLQDAGEIRRVGSDKKGYWEVVRI